MVQAQSQLWATPQCVAQHPLPTHSHAQPQPPHLCALQCWAPCPLAASEAGFLGSGSEPGVPSPVAASDWSLGCVLGGVCAAGLACFTLHSQWADPSVITLTWSLHWVSRTGGWWSVPSIREVDRISPSSADPVGSSAMTVTVSQPCWCAVPGQYGCCFCPLELLLPE